MQFRSHPFSCFSHSPLSGLEATAILQNMDAVKPSYRQEAGTG
jgi:hypothetical protein